VRGTGADRLGKLVDDRVAPRLCQAHQKGGQERRCGYRRPILRPAHDPGCKVKTRLATGMGMPAPGVFAAPIDTAVTMSPSLTHGFSPLRERRSSGFCICGISSVDFSISDLTRW
jgi:hypothetical protein